MESYLTPTLLELNLTLAIQCESHRDQDTERSSKFYTSLHCGQMQKRTLMFEPVQTFTSLKLVENNAKNVLPNNISCC